MDIQLHGCDHIPSLKGVEDSSIALEELLPF